MNTNIFITQDKRMKQILKLLKQVTKYGANILLTGENGTGKDLLARYIHEHGPRRLKPFVKIDCTTIPPDLIESELFGHEKGAFSGAIKTHEGKFELADGGTLYIDKVNEIPLFIQAKLTRILQDRKFERIGGTKSYSIDIHVIASTHENLDKKVRNGSFREDLFFRLSTVPFEIPPLRSRKSDIPLLIKHFIETFSKRYHISKPRLAPQALQLLCSYSWPGNVRELENLIERLVIATVDNHEITTKDIPLKLDDISEQGLETLADQFLTLAEVEKIYIRQILIKTKGNKSKAAEILGINRKTLLEKRRKYNLD